MYTIAKDTMHIIQIKKLIKTELRMGSGTQVPKIETRFFSSRDKDKGWRRMKTRMRMIKMWSKDRNQIFNQRKLTMKMLRMVKNASSMIIIENIFKVND